MPKRFHARAVPIKVERSQNRTSHIATDMNFSLYSIPAASCLNCPDARASGPHLARQGEESR